MDTGAGVVGALEERCRGVSGGDFAGGSLVFFAGYRSRFEGEDPFAPLLYLGLFSCLDHQVSRVT